MADAAAILYTSGATLMAGLVKSHEHIRRINASPFMDEIRAVIEKGGVHVLADARKETLTAAGKNAQDYR